MQKSASAKKRAAKARAKARAREAKAVRNQDKEDTETKLMAQTSDTKAELHARSQSSRSSVDDTSCDQAQCARDLYHENIEPPNVNSGLTDSDTDTDTTYQLSDFPRSRCDSDKINRLRFVAVHLGAKSSSYGDKMALVAKDLCYRVMHTAGINDALEGAVELVRKMELNGKLNCAYGSNLTMDGGVECDASLMSDRSASWAGVGAISGCRSPIELAKCLHDQRLRLRPLGLVPPNLLVGPGAYQWMRTECPDLAIHTSAQISARSFAKYQTLKSRYDLASGHTMRYEKSGDVISITPESGFNPSDHTNPVHSVIDAASRLLKSSPHGRADSQSTTSSASSNDAVMSPSEKYQSDMLRELEESLEEYQLDTVGAIAVDTDYNFACALSSGGIWLKHRGRIGQAALPGAGCWSQDSVAVVTSGVGEYLTCNLLAKKFHDRIHTMRLFEDIGEAGKDKDQRILATKSLIDDATRYCFNDLRDWSRKAGYSPRELTPAAMLAVCSFDPINQSTGEEQEKLGFLSNREHDLFLTFGHNTRSLCIGFMSSTDMEPNSIISDIPLEVEPHNRLYVKTLKI